MPLLELNMGRGAFAILAAFVFWFFGPDVGYGYHFGKFNNLGIAIRGLHPIIIIDFVILAVCLTAYLAPDAFSRVCTDVGYNVRAAIEKEQRFRVENQEKDALMSSVRGVSSASLTASK